MQRILDQIDAPALVRNSRLDHVGANAFGRALYAAMFESREQPPNSARFTFLDPAAVDFYPDWDLVASERSLICAQRPARTPTTASCPTSSASWS